MLRPAPPRYRQGSSAAQLLGAIALHESDRLVPPHVPRPVGYGGDADLAEDYISLVPAIIRVDFYAYVFRTDIL